MRCTICFISLILVGVCLLERTVLHSLYNILYQVAHRQKPGNKVDTLDCWWQHSENHAYMQLDIHDKEGKTSLAIKDNGDWQYIAHRAFYGLLRSDVTCASCSFTSTTHDPCMDISLDLSACNSSRKDFASKSSKPNESLVGCLDLFTRTEKFGSDQKLYCENCHEKQDSLKQMSIKKLHLVLCFHIKRFEHSPTRKIHETIYLSSSIVRKRFGNRIFSFDGDESDVSTEFEIFAVVTHSGMLDSGHCVMYLLLRNQWYICDDAWITEVGEEVVRASQCYLIYYVQKMLYHKSCEDVSCQPMSLRADTFVPITGCC
ncbi:hypothetical protein R3W88_004761 [Solanum pinnatisectum]|uniref:USP domain-containing protein n=1 Tax=Solanum pinnatisectum TaxID=50273 RepID=A0AAV9KBL1_9SOLN|nr:hypothetical protein R3W88_004761 [Solanum pinnatisectum]